MMYDSVIQNHLLDVVVHGASRGVEGRFVSVSLRLWAVLATCAAGTLYELHVYDKILLPGGRKF